MQVIGAVELETGSPVNLTRTDDRNLIRNSGQYWKALGVLEETQPIELTPFGRRVADGGITRDEFVAAVIKTLELPNRSIENEAAVAEFDATGLRITPLALILEILQALAETGEEGLVQLTADELVTVIIPLAGTRAPMREYIDSIRAYRAGTLDLSAWPDCAPAANDKRMAREFLLFLAEYGVLRRTGETRQEERFWLARLKLPAVAEFNARHLPPGAPDAAVEALRAANAAELVDRETVLVELRARPQQARFRREVLEACGNRCLLTAEQMPPVLEASHIIPVEEGGTDLVGNGICLRADIHRLFDAGHVRISPDGRVHLSEEVRRSPTYLALPARIDLPVALSRECLSWRYNYQ